jgi:hypothetical protein
LLLLALASTPGWRADATLFVEEPYGNFGALNPTGHAAIHLSRVCATTPTVLRRCEDGEPGVAISRYSRIEQRDWIAIPLIPHTSIRWSSREMFPSSSRFDDVLLFAEWPNATHRCTCQPTVQLTEFPLLLRAVLNLYVGSLRL